MGGTATKAARAYPVNKVVQKASSKVNEVSSYKPVSPALNARESASKEEFDPNYHDILKQLTNAVASETKVTSLHKSTLNTAKKLEKGAVMRKQELKLENKITTGQLNQLLKLKQSGMSPIDLEAQYKEKLNFTKDNLLANILDMLSIPQTQKVKRENYKGDSFLET